MEKEEMKVGGGKGPRGSIQPKANENLNPALCNLLNDKWRLQ